MLRYLPDGPVDIAPKLSQTHLPSLAIGLSTAVVLSLLGMLGLFGKRVPAALLSVVAASLFVTVTGLEGYVLTVGEIPRSFPPTSRAHGAGRERD